MTATVETAAQPAALGWRRRLLQQLLYGRNVDRGAKSRARVGLAILAFSIGYAIIAGRLIQLAAAPDNQTVRRTGRRGLHLASRHPRPQWRDPRDRREGGRRCSASRASIIDVDEAVELLTAVLPDLDATEVRERLSSKKGFVWLKREITPKQQQEIHGLGIPGIGFLTENKRVYPNGAEVSHLIGLVNIDNQGIAGIEKWLDGRGLADLHMAGLAVDRMDKPIELAVDLRVQHAMRDELLAARDKYKAIAAAGLITDVRTGEIISMVSVPDFDPNNPKRSQRSHPHQPPDHRRLRDGLDLQGAHARDGARFRQGDAQSSFDARTSLRYGKFTIHDYHAQNRMLTVPEIFTYSSNIGTARMALQQGVEQHKCVPEEDGPARPAAHRIAGKRRAARAQALG